MLGTHEGKSGRPLTFHMVSDWKRDSSQVNVVFSAVAPPKDSGDKPSACSEHQALRLMTLEIRLASTPVRMASPTDYPNRI